MSVPVRPAASVVVVDDRPDLHVLIGRRRPGSAFVGGLIVFPGGGVDPDDHTELARARVPPTTVPGLAAAEAAALLHAGVRETQEEVGLVLRQGPFPHIGRWITPEGSPRRYDTHFFLARHEGGEAVADQIELVDVWWERPSTTLERVATGDLDAIAPTLAFLRALAVHDRVEAAFAATRRAGDRAQHDHGWVAF